MDCIYIAWLREYVLAKKNVYKIGNTGNIFRRMRNYPKGSILLHMSMTPHMKIIETELIALFKTQFIWRTDLGREYFEGDFDKMRNLMHAFVDIHKFDFPRNLSINENDHIYNSAAIKIQYHFRKTFQKKIRAVNIIKSAFKKYTYRKKLIKEKLYDNTVKQFINKEIIDEKSSLLYEKDVKNLFMLRFSGFINNNASFRRDIFQKHLGELQIRNGKTVWLNKKFGHKVIQQESDNWKKYIEDYLIKDDKCFLKFSDLKKSFKLWLSINRKKDKPTIGEIKDYFSKNLCSWAHTTFRNQPVEGYKKWSLKKY